jgi:hypothetical protein
MKILHFIILLGGMFLLALFLGKQRFGMDPSERIAWSLAWSWVMTVVGGTFAAVSVLVLLKRGIEGASLPQVLPMVIPLLGGLLIFQSHWALALGLAAVVVAWAVVDFLRPKEGKRET